MNTINNKEFQDRLYLSCLKVKVYDIHALSAQVTPHLKKDPSFIFTRRKQDVSSGQECCLREALVPSSTMAASYMKRIMSVSFRKLPYGFGGQPTAPHSPAHSIAVSITPITDYIV